MITGVIAGLVFVFLIFLVNVTFKVGHHVGGKQKAEHLKPYIKESLNGRARQHLLEARGDAVVDLSKRLVMADSRCDELKEDLNRALIDRAEAIEEKDYYQRGGYKPEQIKGYEKSTAQYDKMAADYRALSERVKKRERLLELKTEKLDLMLKAGTLVSEVHPDDIEDEPQLRQTLHAVYKRMAHTNTKPWEDE